ncbi:MAG: arginyltransferase, partial [Pseudomonadota bacterium]
TYMILDHITRARAENDPHVYLGYWVAGSPQMNYKARFQPQEHLTARGWTRTSG